MWQGKTVSVALPTYHEKDSIRACIDGFFETGVVDEVVVCNNNAIAGTSEEVARTRALEVFEPRQGYGWSCRCALAATRGDLVVLAEPDGSFVPADVLKLLAYSDAFDVVFGSRTHRSCIGPGANMGPFLRWGNRAVAKYLELLFETAPLSDVGCTMRLLSREVLERVLPRARVGGSQFGPELMILCLLSGASSIEIPLQYRSRVGKSMVTGNPRRALTLGLEMIALISALRVKHGIDKQGIGPLTGSPPGSAGPDRS